MMVQCHVNYVHCVIVIMYIPRQPKWHADLALWRCNITKIGTVRIKGPRNYLDSECLMYIMQLTTMKHSKSTPNRTENAKEEALRRQGALHPHPDVVQDEAFRQGEFFDARDLVQVRYEMVRRHQVDGKAVTAVADAFGVSRQAFYTTETAFEQRGISGLLPRRRGPQRAHKCTDEILDFVEQWRAASPTEKDVTEAIRKRFGISINPRSVERALARRKKKR